MTDRTKSVNNEHDTSLTQLSTEHEASKDAGLFDSSSSQLVPSMSPPPPPPPPQQQQQQTRTVAAQDSGSIADSSLVSKGVVASPSRDEDEPGGSDNDGNGSSDINLTFLMVSGARASMSFKPSDTVYGVKKQLFRNWPKAFAECPDSPTHLRIVYMGHFLDDKATLSESKLQPGNSTVHLTIKANTAPEKSSKKDIDKAPKCSCIIL